MTRRLAIFMLMTLVAAEPHVVAQTASRGTTLGALQRCAALNGVRIPAPAIGLPTNGATIVSASLVG